MNFNTLVNTKGIKGSRRGGDVKGFASKAVSVTKDATIKAASTIGGYLPATNNRVAEVEHRLLTNDREIIYEVSKILARTNELSNMLGMDSIPVTTPEEAVEAVTSMEEEEQFIRNQQKEVKGSLPGQDLLKKLQEALRGVRNPTPETVAVQEAIQEVFEEVMAVMPTVSPVTTAGPSRRFVSSPNASAYDYNNISEQA